MDDYVTPEEAAQAFKVSRKSIYKWIRNGKLRSRKLGRSVRIPRTELEQNRDELFGVPPA